MGERLAMDGTSIQGGCIPKGDAVMMSITFTPIAFTEKALQINEDVWLALSLIQGTVSRMQVSQTVKVPEWWHAKNMNIPAQPPQQQQSQPNQYIKPLAPSEPFIPTQPPQQFQQPQASQPIPQSQTPPDAGIFVSILSRLEDIEGIVMDIHSRLFPPQTPPQQQQQQPQSNQRVDFNT